MFWKNKKRIFGVLLVLALLVSQLSGINFKKVKAADTGYTELSLTDFGYTANQAYTGTNHFTKTPSGLTELDGVAITNYITFSTASDGCCVRIGAEGGWAAPVHLFISGTTLWSWDSSGGGKHTQLGTVTVGAPFKLRMEFDTVDSSGTSVTQVKFYLNDAATPTTVVYTQLFVVNALVYGGDSTVTIGEVTTGEEGEEETTTYTELTFSDYEVRDVETTEVVYGKHAASASTTGYDKLAFTGYLKFQSGATNGGNLLQFGNLVSITSVSDTSIQLKNPNTNIGYENAAFNCGKTIHDTYIKLRLEFNIVDGSYVATVYVDDTKLGDVTLIASTSFTYYTMIITPYTNETFGVKSYSDAYTEMTFSDFNIADQTVSGTATASSYVGGNSGAVQSGDSLNHVAFSGYVTFPSGAIAMTNLIQFGNLIYVTTETDSTLRLRNPNNNAAYGDPFGVGSVVTGRAAKIRLEFDVINNGADYQVKAYIDDVLALTTTITGGVEQWTYYEMLVYAYTAQDVSVGSYKQGVTYKELTFRDLGIDDQKVVGGDSAEKSVQGTTTLGSSATCMNDVAFTGYVKFPDGATAMANKIQFGNLVYVTTENSTSLRLRLKDQTNEAYGSVIDCGKTITNTFIKLRLEFNIIDDEYVVKVHVDDTLVATQTLTGSKALFTWYPMLVCAEAAKTLEIKSYPEIQKTFTELTFSDFGVADQTVFGTSTGSANITGTNATLVSTKSLADHAFTGYIKIQKGAQAGGTYIRFGNLLYVISLNDSSSIQLYDPVANASYADSVFNTGVDLKGNYVKFRFEFEFAGTSNEDYLVTMYANDEKFGSYQIVGGVAKFQEYQTFFVQTYKNEKVSVKSYPEKPATFTELTFSDFKLGDQVVTGSSTEAKSVSNYNDGVKASASLSGVAFTGYVKFKDGAVAMGDLVQFGNLMYITPVSSTALQIKLTSQTSVSDAIECGKTITGKYIKLRVEFTVSNTTDYIVRIFVDDVEMDAWLISGGVSLFPTYTALLVRAHTNSQVAIKSYPSYTSSDARVFEDLTTSDFNIADGTYTNVDDVSGEFASTVTGTGHNTLNGKNISANVTFSQADSAIYIGGTDKTTGLMIGTDAAQEGKLLIKEASGLGGLTEFYADADTAGATLVGSEVKLTVSFEKVDSDSDANTDDVKVGIYFNDKLYNGEYIYLTNYTLGTYMGVVATDADASVKISAIDRNKDIDAYEYRSLTNVMESYYGSYYVLGNGMTNVYGEINGVFDLSVEDVAYGAVLQSLDGSDWYLRYAGLSSSPWETLDITADQNAGTLTFGHATNVFTNKWTVGTDLDFTKETMVEISTDYVDADWDGSNNDVKVGIWVNGKLSNNQYFYLIDYVNRMGTGVIYAGAPANTLQFFETGDNPVMDVEYDTEITADGFVIPECDSATINGKAASAGTKLTATGVHEVSYVDHGMTYHNTVTITKLGDANMDSTLGAKDIVNMMNNLGQTDADELKMKCADINNDNAIGTSDIADLKDLILGNTTAKTMKDKYKTKTIIGAISDTHLRADGINDYQRQNNYREALEYYKNRGADVIFMNGDISDLGEVTSYEKLVNIFNEVYADVPASERPEVITTADNHEYFDAWWWLNGWDQNGKEAANALQTTKDTFRNGLSSMDTYLGETTGEYMHTVRRVNNYICIGMSEDYLLGGAAGFNSASITWLDQQLAASTAEDPNRPVFIAIHQPPQNTVLASELYGNGITAFSNVLAKYPQAIVFGSHTHAPVKDHRSIYQNQYTVLNTGTTYYTSRTEYNSDNATSANQITWANALVDEEQVSEGLLLEVEGNKVKVEAWDFWNAELIREYSIDTSQGTAGFKYTDAQQIANTPTPVFGEDATMEIQQVSGTEVKLLFPSATNEGSFVHHYTVKVKNGSTVVSTLYYDSYFRKGIGNMAKEQELTVTGLTAGTKYTFEVTAGNSFWEESAALTATMS